jgi:hypothetical protein
LESSIRQDEWRYFESPIGFAVDSESFSRQLQTAESLTGWKCNRINPIVGSKFEYQVTSMVSQTVTRSNNQQEILRQRKKEERQQFEETQQENEENVEKESRTDV